MIDSKLRTVGDLLDRIEQASRDERRRIADQVRTEAGLTNFTEIEDNRRIARERQDDPPRPTLQGPPRESSGKAIQECAAEGCAQLSLDDWSNPGPIASDASDLVARFASRIRRCGPPLSRYEQALFGNAFT